MIAGPNSRRQFRRAERVLVGGVDSPVRAFAAVGGSPLFFQRGRGPYLFDLDGERYSDFVGSWGALILGHAPNGVLRAVRQASGRGLSFGAPTVGETELAERIRDRAPVLERLRFVNSGTEAVMSAVRLARGCTGRRRVVKFAGGYHGHSDGLLARAGSGPATAALPDSAGVPQEIVGLTHVARFNDPGSVEKLFSTHGKDIAAVVVEPVAGNMGVVAPRPGFLRTISRLAHDHGAVVIADEVITGFRLRPGLAHPALGLDADLVTLGKVIGGGLPVGAYGGTERLMGRVAPAGPVYQAGTLSGNPVVMAAGIATLDALTPNVYHRLNQASRRFAGRIRSGARQAGVRGFSLAQVGSMLGFFFTDRRPGDFDSAQRTDRRRYREFFQRCLEQGVYLPPSPLETAFISAAHSDRVLDDAGRSMVRALAGSTE